MNRIFAITSIAIRNAIRSKIVVMLMVPLIFAAVGIPLMIKGDGTMVGKVKILLNYSLGFSLAVLSIVTLWSGCASISTEIHEKLIHTVVSKPISRFQIWLGKWFALLIVNFLLVAFAGIAIYGGLRWQTRLAGEEQETLHQTVLTSRKMVPHIEPTVPDEMVKSYYEEALRQGRPEIPIHRVRNTIKNELLDRRAVVRKEGGETFWLFEVKDKLREDHPLYLRYRFDLLAMASESESPGIWRFGKQADSPQIPVLHEAQLIHEIEIPKESIDADGRVMITYVNQSSMDVLMDRNYGPSLLFYREPFVVNYMKALLMLFFQLAFLAAIGLTAGSLFSLPVAALVSFFLILLQSFGGFLEKYEQITQSGILGPFYKFLHMLTGPLQGPNAMEQLANGNQIAAMSVVSMFLIKVLLYCGVIALIGNLLFNRREIGIPS